MQPKPTILAFDTSAAHCAAALLLGDRIITRVDEMAKGQAEHLMVMLEEVLSGEDLSWKDLDGIGVGVGPGNFTGIRIAVSAARGLALGLGKPAIGINGFEARAFQQTRPFTAEIPAPRALQSENETPWLYEGSNVPVDREWLFGVMDNGIRYAVRRNGVPTQQLFVIAHGPNHPLADNQTPAGRAENRRIEFVVYPDTF